MSCKKYNKTIFLIIWVFVPFFLYIVNFSEKNKNKNKKYCETKTAVEHKNSGQDFNNVVQER